MQRSPRLLLGVVSAGAVFGLAAPATLAASAPTARVGAYYFDGWAGPLGGVHFQGLVNGPYTGRRPLFGWRDAAPSTMSTQLGWAHSDGIGFFVFDWFYNAGPGVGDDPYLNTSLDNYRKLKYHHGVKYALMYTNGDPWTIQPDAWQSETERLVKVDFMNPNYERIRGEPVFFIFNSFAFAEEFGGTAGVNEAFSTLRRAARRHGLPGVFIVAGLPMGAKEDWLLSGRPIVVGDDYDAVTQYWYGAFAGFRDGEQPYHDVVAAEESFWNELLTDSPWPYIPDVMDGWDPRPWNEDVLGHLWWFLRTPAEVGAFTRDAIAWARTHAEANVEPRSQPPMIVVESWNEFGEGAQILPTVDEGYTYGQALAKALGIRWTPARFRVDIRVAGRGRVTSSPRGIACPGKCGSTSADGSTVTLHALPARGATFSGWSGACAGHARTCRISVTTDLVARARFTG